MNYIIINKSPTTDTHAVALVVIQTEEELNSLYDEYIRERRDKYDPYEFIEWLSTRYDAKYHKPDSTIFKREFNKATKFNFHKPLGRRLISKEIKNATKRKRTISTK